MTLLFYGLDLAKKHSQLAILDPLGNELANFKFDSSSQNFLQLAQFLRPSDEIAFEVSTSANGVMSLFAKHSAAQAVLSNPLFTKSISKAVVKSDREDARKLADLKRTNYLETVWFPDADTLRLRHFISDRQSLGQTKTKLKNQVHSVLQRNLISYCFSDLFGGEGSDWLHQFLQTEALDIFERDRIGFLLAEIARQTALVEDLDQTIAAFISSHARFSHQLNLLLSIPGVSLASGATILAAIGDISRFPSAKQLACYFGLTQRLKQTGGKPARVGKISKAGNAYGRFMLIEAAEHLRRSPTIYRRSYEKISKKKGHNVAVVAIARRLAELVWHLLTKNEEFIYARPKQTDDKRAKVKQMARTKADLKLTKKPTNRILYGTNLRGKEIKDELRRRACDEALKIYDLLELGNKLAEISPTGFNPRQPRFTDWQKLLETIAQEYAAEIAENKENQPDKKAVEKEAEKEAEKSVKKMT
jgi:transposase